MKYKIYKKKKKAKGYFYWFLFGIGVVFFTLFAEYIIKSQGVITLLKVASSLYLIAFIGEYYKMFSIPIKKELNSDDYIIKETK